MLLGRRYKQKIDRMGKWSGRDYCAFCKNCVGHKQHGIRKPSEFTTIAPCTGVLHDRNVLHVVFKARGLCGLWPLVTSYNPYVLTRILIYLV